MAVSCLYLKRRFLAYSSQGTGYWLDEAVGVCVCVCVCVYVSPLGSPSKQEVWGRRGAFGGRNTGRRRRRRRRERGRGLNFKKPLTHAAAGPDHSTDAFVHSLSLSSPSLSFIPCVFGDTRRVQISKSHCLLRLQTGAPSVNPNHICAPLVDWSGIFDLFSSGGSTIRHEGVVVVGGVVRNRTFGKGGENGPLHCTSVALQRVEQRTLKG